jgi:hypothetical protein
MNSLMVFADAGPPDIVFLPFLGVVGVAACFFVVGLVAGGFWFIGGSAAPRARKLFLASATFVSLVLSAICWMMWWFWEEMHAWIPAFLFLTVAVLGWRSLRQSGPVAPETSPSTSSASASP